MDADRPAAVWVEGGWQRPADGMNADTWPVEPLPHDQYVSHVHRLANIREKRAAAAYNTVTSSVFINRVITHFGQYKAALESNPQEVAACVEHLARGLLRSVGSHDARFVGRLRSCGSYHDGLKIRHANEFGYLLELSADSLGYEDVDWIRVTPDSLRPGTDSGQRGRSYFKAKFKGRVPDVWRCPDCRMDGADDCVHRKELAARQVQTDFFNALKTSLSKLNPEWSGAEITCSGSAVTIYTKIGTGVSGQRLLNKHGLRKIRQHKQIDLFVVKIHLTLAIPVQGRDKDDKWPPHGLGHLELNPEILGPSPEIRKCHLVIVGDYWQVSFVQLERKLLRNLTEDPGKKKCFQAIKHLRDVVDIADPCTDALLTGHPLTLAFFKENRHHDKEEQWRFWSLAVRVRNMLAHVEGGHVTSYFLNDRPSLPRSERLSDECRRISRYLDRLECQYHRHGLVHFGVVSLLFVIHLVLFSLGAASLALVRGQAPLSCDGTRSADLGSYGYVHLPLSVVSLVVSTAGAASVAFQRTLSQSYNVLYDMYRAIGYCYVTLAGLDALLVGFGIGLAVLLNRFFSSGCADWDGSGIMALTLCTICLAALVVLAMVVHGVFYVVSIRDGRLAQYGWEIVLPDFIYKDAFPCLRRHTRDPPRVSVSVNKKEAVSDETDSDSEGEGLADRAASTLEGRGCKPRPEHPVTCTEAIDLSLSYDSYNGGRFNPISPMLLAASRTSAGSVRPSRSQSPASDGLAAPYNDAELGSGHGGVDGIPERQQSPSVTSSTYSRGSPDYPEPVADGLRLDGVLDTSYRSSVSESARTRPGAVEMWKTRRRDDLQQASWDPAVHAKHTSNGSYNNHRPLRIASFSGTPTTAAYRSSWTGSSTSYTSDIHKHRPRFIDVAI